MTHGCQCCFRTWSLTSQGEPPSGSRAGLPGTSPPICVDCFRHYNRRGADAVERRDQEHKIQWANSLASLVRQHQNLHAFEVDRLNARIAELEAELQERPERIVHENLDRQTVQDAQDERERALRSRDAAYQTLVEIRLAHREGEKGKCRCGRRLSQCRVVEILQNFPPLERWEERQVERLRKGLQHRLPDGHPALIDPRILSA